MNRTEWKSFHRSVRETRRNQPARRPFHEFNANGIPYKMIAHQGEPTRILAIRIPDRPTAQLVARELHDAAEERRLAKRGRTVAKHAARLSLEMAQRWRHPSWREEARAAGRAA